MEAKRYMRNVNIKFFRVDYGTPDASTIVEEFCKDKKVYDIQLLKTDSRFVTIAVIYVAYEQ